GAYPFLRHEFLAALEHSGCVGEGTAWHPVHLSARDESGRLVGALPLYLKFDSRGEFVFDWGWADAFERAGLAYYPKLVAAIPFTPANGPRMLLAADSDTVGVSSALLSACSDLAELNEASSIHVLFPDDRDREILASAGYLARKGCQFHWRNRGYSDFSEFLAEFTSAKRKKVRRERRRIAEAGIMFEHLRADELSPADWEAVFGFYSRTFMRRGRSPYLNRDFFDEISATMPENLIVILARYGTQPIAGAICFRSDTALYGRYWGSLADFHSLHFETCYYQGIEYCINEGLALFEPGTQGEHKVSRGFSPTQTWSCHQVFNAEFRSAIEDFLHRETAYVDAYIDEVDEHIPYKSKV
ncbi:MAG: GNAT family N-acetyltransferase, partial [Gammaproteobacteria bacterium]